MSATNRCNTTFRVNCRLPLRIWVIKNKFIFNIKKAFYATWIANTIKTNSVTARSNVYFLNFRSKNVFICMLNFTQKVFSSDSLFVFLNCRLDSLIASNCSPELMQPLICHVRYFSLASACKSLQYWFQPTKHYFSLLLRYCCKQNDATNELSGIILERSLKL